MVRRRELDDQDLDTVRIPPGAAIKGPEPYDCYNTGMAPFLKRLSSEEVYLVGPENYVRECYSRHCRDTKALCFWLDSSSYTTTSGKTVYAYKTRKSAVKKYRALLTRMQENNRHDLLKHRDAVQKLHSTSAEERIKGAMDMVRF